MRRKYLYVLFAPLVIALTGCPRVAYIDVYNNTNNPIVVNPTDPSAVGSRDDSGEADPFSSVRVPLLYSSFYIESDQGVWKYRRNVPHDGRDGPYFDGTLRIQVNSDGLGYALKEYEDPPIENFEVQPPGYPLQPMNDK